MRLKRKSRSHRYDIDRPRPRHGQKITKYKMCLSIMMSVCIKQHLSNISSSIHEKVKQHWGWAEKSAAYEKSAKPKLTVTIKFNLLNINGGKHKCLEYLFFSDTSKNLGSKVIWNPSSDLKETVGLLYMRFSMKGFISKCDYIRSFLRIWSHLLKKSLMENWMFLAVKFEVIWPFVANLASICNTSFSPSLFSSSFEIPSATWRI